MAYGLVVNACALVHLAFNDTVVRQVVHDTVNRYRSCCLRSNRRECRVWIAEGSLKICTSYRRTGPCLAFTSPPIATNRNIQTKSNTYFFFIFILLFVLFATNSLKFCSHPTILCSAPPFVHDLLYKILQILNIHNTRGKGLC